MTTLGVSVAHNVGIIGFGKIGEIRKEIIDSIPDWSVKWICDPVLQQGDFRYTENPDAIFNDSEVDTVFIATPNYLNKGLVIKGLDSKKHVFCEKPIGTSTAQVVAIIEAEKRNPDRKLMIGFNHRWHPGIQLAKSNIDSGKFGKILWMRGRYGKSVDDDFQKNWRSRKGQAGGGILMDQGIHMLDLFLMFCGHFEEVKSFCSNSYCNLDVEDNVFAIFRNTDGQVASLHSTMTQWRHLFSLEIFMDQGYIVINGLNTPSQTYGKEEVSIAENRTTAPRATWTKEEKYVFSIDSSFTEEVKEFFHCIESDSPILTGNTDNALKVIDLVERVYAST
jgi:predicted dehydrogenase